MFFNQFGKYLLKVDNEDTGETSMDFVLVALLLKLNIYESVSQ